MTVVDSSALMAIVEREAFAKACEERLIGASELLISAATLAESLIVAQRRGVGAEMTELIATVSPTVRSVDESLAFRAADVYRRYGKGVHSAKLNYGDCFAYALAEAERAPLLYVGNDFNQTPIRKALAR